MPPDLLQWIAAIAPAIGVYAAIRADLATARQKADLAHDSASEAHRRLDDHIDMHMKGVSHG